jgi:hypothetical protein
MCLTRIPSSGRNYAATRIAAPYLLFASSVIVGSTTAVTNAGRRSGVSSVPRPATTRTKYGVTGKNRNCGQPGRDRQYAVKPGDDYPAEEPRTNHGGTPSQHRGATGRAPRSEDMRAYIVEPGQRVIASSAGRMSFLTLRDGSGVRMSYGAGLRLLSTSAMNRQLSRRQSNDAGHEYNRHFPSGSGEGNESVRPAPISSKNREGMSFEILISHSVDGDHDRTSLYH